MELFCTLDKFQGIISVRNTSWVTVHVEKSMKNKKMPGFGTQKMPIWKYSMCILHYGEKFRFLKFMSWKMPLFWHKKRAFYHLEYFFGSMYLAKMKIICSTSPESVKIFRHKNFENWLRNDWFMASRMWKTYKLCHLLS